MDKTTISRDQEVLFHNWTDKDHTGVWIDGGYKVSSSPVTYSPVKRKVYELKAGKSYYLPFYLAEHFAKEIADREYWTAFNEKLEKIKAEKKDGNLDRRQLEHQVANSEEIRKLSRQEMMDKCVEIIETDDVEMVRPREFQVKEMMLNRDERAKELRERFPGIETPRVNEQAIRESSEEFEKVEEKVE